jgi:hypothetical protein
VAQAVVEVLTNPAEWARLAANARRRLNAFLYEQFAARLHAHLELGPAVVPAASSVTA